MQNKHKAGTEEPHPLSKGIDSLEALEVLGLMHREDFSALEAVGRSMPDIARAVAEAVDAISSGGRVFYIGAGTSGRLGVLDAAEIPPTFGVDCFRAIIAGGPPAVTESVEGAEDDTGAARREASKIGPGDLAMGISASGKTPFVLAALQKARDSGARCWLLTCNDIEPYPFLDGQITMPTGPEIVAGSTRLKAATATKMALSMFSTATMIRLGGVYDGLMVDLVPANRKLAKRAEGIITAITGCGEAEASELLAGAGGRPKVAALMKLRGLSREEAERLLEDSRGSLRRALGG